jgi:hypothetical protein
MDLDIGIEENDLIDSLLEEEDVFNDFELNIDWIQQFESTDEKFKNFYNEWMTSIRYRCIYLDNRKNIKYVTNNEEQFHLLENTISKDDIIKIIKKNAIHERKQYSLLSIAKYNIDIQTNDIKDFLKDDLVSLSDPYFSEMKQIDAISFKKTIAMFHELNELVIIYQDKQSEHSHNAKTNKHIGDRKKYTRKIHMNISSV